MNRPPLPPGSGGHFPPTREANAPRLDEKADFDDYSVYYQGHLNEYMLLKEGQQNPQECAVGLDQKADFDDYTAYYDGHLNTYALMKDAQMTQGIGPDKREPAVPNNMAAVLESTPIYEECIPESLNPSSMVDEKDSPYVFPELEADDTVYEKSPSNMPPPNIAEEKRRTRISPRSGREQQRVRAKVRRRVRKTQKVLDPSCGNQLEPVSDNEIEEISENEQEEGSKSRADTEYRGPQDADGRRSLDGEVRKSSAGRMRMLSDREVIKTPENVKKPRLDETADFDEYTEYEQGELNEYGLMKDALRQGREGVGVGLDEHANFDEYTIYDQGHLNEYGILKDMRRAQREGATGVDQHADFDEYTVVDEGELNEYGLLKDLRMKPKDCAVGEDEEADISDYTAYLKLMTDIERQRQEGAPVNTVWGGGKKP